MAVEDWIDKVAEVWEFVAADGKTVVSYRAFDEHNVHRPFPEALSVFPCALSYTTEYYPLGVEGTQEDLYQGVTEFHCVSSVDKSHYPYVLTFLAKIRDAAAINSQLGGEVSWFKLLFNGGPGPFGGVGVEGPAALSYGSEEEHLGLLVRWAVKESVSVTTGS